MVVQSSSYNETISQLQLYICNCFTLVDCRDMENIGCIIYNLQHVQCAKNIENLRRYIRAIIRMSDELACSDNDYFYISKQLFELLKEYQNTETLMHEHGKNVFGELLE